MTVLVVGAGIFGVTAALALKARGRDVKLVDPGPIPHADAESTDMSKVVRLDYGADEATTAMMEIAIDRWREWNGRFATRDVPFFRETGVLFAAHSPMKPGGFEHDSMEVLLRRGHPLERLDAEAIAKRFPVFAPRALVAGYYNPIGGWVASGTVVERLAHHAIEMGVEVAAGVRAERLLERGSRIAGIIDDKGEVHEAEVVVVAAGSWTMKLCPWLTPHLRRTGQPVFYLLPHEWRSFESPHMPVFGADIATTGWYGFPWNAGFVKIANHGVGVALDSDLASERRKLRSFLSSVIPALADVQIAKTRICVYCDTADGNFWIAPDPERDGLVVATGGSGHAFKFAPLLGDIIADAVSGEVDPRYRWRLDALSSGSTDAARAR